MKAIHNIKIPLSSDKEIQQIKRKTAKPVSHGNKVWNSSFTIIDFLSRYNLQKIDTAIDVGCGWGVVLAYLQKQGIDCGGIDIDVNTKPYVDVVNKYNKTNVDVLYMDYKELPREVFKRIDLIIGCDICYWEQHVGNIKKLINISTDLSVDEYENIFRKMATDRTYEPPIDISAKGKGLTSNYRKAKANVKKEIPQLQKLINQNSRKRKTIKRNAKRKANPDLQTKYLAEAQTRRDTKRFREKGKIKLNPREIGLNTQQRFIIKQANDLINQNPEELLKDKKLLDKISFRVDNEGNIYKSKPDLKAVLDPKNDARFFHLSHARRAELGTELTDSPINRFASTFNQNNEFIKDAERFIENNPKDPKVNNIIKKAKELKLTLRPDVPPGTFKTKYLGYTEDLDKPVGKIKTVINQYMPKGLKSKLSKISKVAKIVGRPVLRVAAPIIPFAGPAIMAMGAADVAKAAEQGAYGLDESPVAYYLGPEAAVGLKNLKQKAALSENTPYQEIEDYLPDEDLSGILSLKGVQ